MNEKDIRDRIGQFLKKTARTVIVPASMGIGLSSTACNGNGLHNKAGDGGPDGLVQNADTRVTGPDLAEDAIKYDVPLMMVPYVVAMPWDAAVDRAPDDSAQNADADRDVFPDARADISFPPPPYLAPLPPDAAADVAREASRADAAKDALPDVRADLPSPPPPYLIYLPAEEVRPAPASPPQKKK